MSKMVIEDNEFATLWYHPEEKMFIISTKIYEW